MARIFDGTDDVIVAPSNSVAGINGALSSWAMWVWVNGDGADNVICQESNLTGGQENQSFFAGTPTTAGWVITFLQRTNGQAGTWSTDADITSGAWHHMGVKYDRGSLSNNPVFYVDGSSVALTETTTPTMTIQTGEDNIKFGEDVDGVDDLDGRLAEIGIWNVLLEDEEFLALSRGIPPLYVRSTALQCYLPLDGNFANEPELIKGVQFAVTGAAFTEHPPQALGAFDMGLGDWPGAFTAAAAPGLSIPLAAHHYKTMQETG